MEKRQFVPLSLQAIQSAWKLGIAMLGLRQGCSLQRMGSGLTWRQ